MKLSTLISKLETVKRVFGDIDVCTFDGKIKRVRLTASRDGVVCPQGQCNEAVIEFDTEME